MGHLLMEYLTDKGYICNFDPSVVSSRGKAAATGIRYEKANNQNEAALIPLIAQHKRKGCSNEKRKQSGKVYRTNHQSKIIHNNYLQNKKQDIYLNLSKNQK